MTLAKSPHKMFTFTNSNNLRHRIFEFCIIATSLQINNFWCKITKFTISQLFFASQILQLFKTSNLNFVLNTDFTKSLHFVVKKLRFCRVTRFDCLFVKFYYKVTLFLREIIADWSFWKDTLSRSSKYHLGSICACYWWHHGGFVQFLVHSVTSTFHRTWTPLEWPNRDTARKSPWRSATWTSPNGFLSTFL